MTVEEPVSALRAQNLDDAFQQTVDIGGSQGAPSHGGLHTQQGKNEIKEIKVYAPRTPLSAETSYAHDFCEHPVEMRCVPVGARACVGGG